MPVVPLTDAFLRQMEPPAAGRVEYIDRSSGVVLRVTVAGVMSWSVVYRRHGKKTRKTLGKYPALTLKDARKLALEVHRQVILGEDPNAEQRARKASPTVRELLTEYDEQEARRMKSGRQRMQVLHRELRPWMSRKVVDVTRRDLVLLLDGIRDRGAPVSANRTLGLVVRLWNFACERGHIEHSPFLGVRMTKEHPRARVLTDDELRGMWRISGSVGNCLRFMACTGVRGGEAVDCQRDEISDGVLHIAGSRTKTGDDLFLPLSTMAHRVLANCPEQGYLFPSRLYGRPLRRDALSHAVKREGGTFTPHDIRRTVRTRLAALGVPVETCERILGHRLPKIQRVYDQHVPLNAMREALEAWSDELERIGVASS